MVWRAHGMPEDRARTIRARAPVILLVALLLLGGATWLAVREVEPFATWYYPLAWYPVLLAMDAAVGRLRGRFLLLDRPRRLLSLLLWSIPVWLAFETVNFRVGNWYYVFVPDRRPEAWTGICTSFATVLPAVFLSSTVVAEATGLGAGLRWPGFRAGPRLLRGIRLAGVAMVLLALAWPRYFFPLVWGSVTLLVEPTNCRRGPERSLLGDLERGRPGRILRLLVGGAVVGLLWELFNAAARGRWIYTVPGLEELKLFEMPLLGFLGFPVFALDCYAIYQLLVNLRVAVPVPGVAAAVRAGERPGEGGAPSPARGRTALGGAGAALLSVLVLLGMERWTVSSTTPRLRDLPGLYPGDVESLVAWRIESPFDLAGLSPAEVAGRVPGVRPGEAEAWVASARLAVLRGIGTRNVRRLWAVGIRSVAELAEADPGELAARLDAGEGPRVPLSRIRVWIRAAREAVAGGGT